MTSDIQSCKMVVTSDILAWVGVVLLGMLGGEMVHRLCLLWEEWPHLNTRYQGNKVRMVLAVFSTDHNQHLHTLTLAILATWLVSYNTEMMLGEVMPWMMVWAVARMYNVFDHQLDTQDIISDNNAVLGPGLAANYWWGILRYLLSRSIPTQLSELLTQCNIENITYFNKLIILIPHNCQVTWDNKEQLEQEKIFYLGDLIIHTARHTVNQAVYWIYQSEEDEEIKPENGKKILVFFDFPQILHSAMGDNRGFVDDDETSEIRRKNIESFIKTLENLIRVSDHIDYHHRRDVIFHRFVNTEDTNIAGEIRQICMKHLAQDIHDDSESDGEE